MPETTDLTYAALITISLPTEGASVSVTVTLSPADLIVAEGQAKPLSDCTLADLRRYAAELEADVWQTYQDISLPDLDADEGIEIVVAIPDRAVEDLTDWPQQALIVSEIDKAGEPAEASLAPLVEATAADETVLGPAGAAESEETALTEQEEQTAEAETAVPLLDDAADPEVAVAESELVFPEIEVEVEVATEAQAVVEEPGAAEVIPSQARVRVAGERRPLGDQTWAAVDILIDEPALRAAQAHALSSLHREVAGVLIGRRPEKQPDGRYVVHIFDTIVAKHTVMQGASVTYTPESWRYLNDTLNERYPDETAVMVGWYHTHPGFGIFLSGMDQFIHQNFFTQIWHVAMVLDPQARTSGFFCWDRPKSRVSRYDFAWPAWAADSW